MQRVQSLQNAAARLVTATDWCSSTRSHHASVASAALATCAAARRLQDNRARLPVFDWPSPGLPCRRLPPVTDWIAYWRVATGLLVLATPTATYRQWYWRTFTRKSLRYVSCFIAKWAQNAKLLTLSWQLQWNQSFTMLSIQVYVQFSILNGRRCLLCRECESNNKLKGNK